MAVSKKLKIWLRDPLPVRAKIKGVEYEIRPDVLTGGPGSMHLEVVRIDSGKTVDLADLPAKWYRDEYDAHAHFESTPGSAARRLANALLQQGLAVTQPEPGWVYRYEHSVKWGAIALGCEYHAGSEWCKKESEEEPPPLLSGYLIRY